ncbi:MAG: alpha/beta hydrolase [Nitrososphaerota archaeon]|nr:alpha/beta hydrolase [Nitrososphaerota archaeon]
MFETVVSIGGTRKLRVFEGGDPGGKPVFYLHGTPSSGVLDPRWVTDAHHQGIRIISYNRPGYGASTPFPGRRVADVTEDVVAIADQLGISHFAVWGVSGGGPHALACASKLWSRCVAVASLASPAPPEYGRESRSTKVNKHVDCEPLPTPQSQEAWMEGHRSKELNDARSMLSTLKVLANDRPSLRRSLYRLLTPFFVGRAEAKPLSVECAQWVVAGLTEAISQGIEGGLEDAVAIYHQPWGFDLGSTRVPVLLWHGERDQFVRVEEGRWLSPRIPGVEARFTRGDGHVSLTELKIPEVHRWLLSKF